jgi:hypothetical protein
MSHPAKRELLAQVASRYRAVGHTQKSVILDEFVAATGYSRKYAIRLLTGPLPPATPIQRPRPRQYGAVVQQALTVAWAAANYVCAKRLVPFLPELVESLERHGHLLLSNEERTQLLTMSAATADRVLRPIRQSSRPRGVSTTKAGNLLKHQIPIRTFADWEDVRPGFMEADLVAHCGNSAEGAFLNTLVLTDVASAWTECLPLLHRSQEAVIQAMDWARQLLPFPLLGIDTDNGTEFVNAQLLAYCGQHQITFTRGRARKKNDQCFVEQKNGSIVRHLVGYDRFEGEMAYRQLTELYRAVRLYVNFFQPSMKLREKKRDGSSVHRTYDKAQTPFQRLLAADVLVPNSRERLDAIYHALDPVRLLGQVETLQDALWRHAVFNTPAGVAWPDSSASVAFDVRACGMANEFAVTGIESECAEAGLADKRGRKYHRLRRPPLPHTWRTRPDPFEGIWDEACSWLAAHPEQTAKSLLSLLQERYPGQFPEAQLRTLQRRVKTWRAGMILTFDEGWLREEVLAGQPLPTVLRAVPATVPARASEKTALPDPASPPTAEMMVAR